MQITCPICHTLLKDVPEDFPTRPFCSQRCKLADLHNWLTGEYRISTPLEAWDPEDDDSKLHN